MPLPALMSPLFRTVMSALAPRMPGPVAVVMVPLLMMSVLPVSLDLMPAALGPLTLIVPLLINVLFDPRASRPWLPDPVVVMVP